MRLAILAVAAEQTQYLDGIARAGLPGQPTGRDVLSQTHARWNGAIRMASTPATLRQILRRPAPTILAIAALGALLATSAPPLAAQTFDPGDESCNGKPEGTACWMELANHPQCYLWNPNLHLGASATWGAECADGLAQGIGTVTWTFGGDKLQFAMGRVERGQQDGRWIILGAGDSSGEDLYYYAGAFVDGREYGRWVLRFPSGTTEEGPFVDGQRHGRWVVRDSDGNTCAAEYARGEQQGECK